MSSHERKLKRIKNKTILKELPVQLLLLPIEAGLRLCYNIDRLNKDFSAAAFSGWYIPSTSDKNPPKNFGKRVRKNDL